MWKLTDNDVATLENALRIAAESAADSARVAADCGLADTGRALDESADQYRALLNQLVESDGFSYDG